MDIETKEAVLKLAGYEFEWRLFPQGNYYCWFIKTDNPNEFKQRAFTKESAIAIAYTSFLTRQNDVIES
jgi:hypothetical protein